MSLRFAFSDVAKAFVDTIVREIQRPVAKAASAAVREAGEIAKRDGRASIAAAGFSRKWQNALRVNFYPSQGDSIRPAAFVFHKIRYAGVFGEGAVIGGQPRATPRPMAPSSGRARTTARPIPTLAARSRSVARPSRSTQP